MLRYVRRSDGPPIIAFKLQLFLLAPAPPCNASSSLHLFLLATLPSCNASLLHLFLLAPLPSYNSRISVSCCCRWHCSCWRKFKRAGGLAGEQTPDAPNRPISPQIGPRLAHFRADWAVGGWLRAWASAPALGRTANGQHLDRYRSTALNYSDMLLVLGYVVSPSLCIYLPI